MRLIELASPFFFVAIAIEWWLSRRKSRTYYRLEDTLADLGTGMIEQLSEYFIRLVAFVPYVFILRHAPFKLFSNSLSGWVFAFVAVDFVYYWFHRACHEVSVLWAAHSVHHSSEEYNLAVALRQSSVQSVFNAIFFYPLAAFGLELQTLLTCYSINLIYQFWIHTRMIDRLGPFERVFNTPSHHRVHHGQNPKYCDRNHGGVFIVWDRLFGTFQIEEEEPVYGTIKPLKSWDPLWANLRGYVDLIRDTLALPSWSDRFKLWFKGPGWRPASWGGPVTPPPVSVATFRKYETQPSQRIRIIAVIAFTGVVFGTLHFQKAANLSTQPIATLAVWAIALTGTLALIGRSLSRLRGPA